MKSRDLSIDILKIIAMLAVVSEHMLLSVESYHIPENVYWAIRGLCKINVNTFIIATAYLSIGRPTRLVNCLRIFLSAIVISTVSYGVSIYIVTDLRTILVYKRLVSAKPNCILAKKKNRENSFCHFDLCNTSHVVSTT